MLDTMIAGNCMRAMLCAAIVASLANVARADAIDDAVAAQMAQLKLPGVALAVVRDGKPLTVRTYGTANLEWNVPVTRETVFELGSVTKQFTSFAIMLLVEDGRLQLDDSVVKHLPELPGSWRDITVRHLLHHSSGVQEYLSVPGLSDKAHALPHRDMTRLFGEQLKREFAPGETWAYSNSGYLLLGDIIERVSGVSYWEFLRARIFTPLRMTSTRSSEPRALIRHRAAGYGWRDGAFENRPALSENAYSAGAIVSTIDDMIRWEAALHSRELLSARSYRELWTPLPDRNNAPPPFSYAFGWVVDAESGHRAVFHSGGTPGFSSAIRRYVDDGLAVIVLANHSDRILDHVPQEIAGLVMPALARPRGANDPDPQRTARLLAAMRGLFAGKPELQSFTPAMQRFLATSTGRGLGEWIVSHGELRSMRYVKTERRGDNETLRYAARMGEAELWLSITVTPRGEIAQVYWW